MPHIRDNNLAHYKTMLADFEYELNVQMRRGGSDVEMPKTAVARTRNTIASLMASRGIGSVSADSVRVPRRVKKAG
ncbi:MAG: hypothetical protein EON93_03365 [Burkholderiales bacterium]|nr:MAG: hypothetical protein EON93_03365 [Burkholderiales bacterium]